KALISGISHCTIVGHHPARVLAARDAGYRETGGVQAANYATDPGWQWREHDGRTWAGMPGRDRMTGTAAASPRRELAVLLACGAVGAGGILLASRQELAKVIVRAPRPLPDTVTSVSAQDLRPAIAALAVAGLASLAAVLATRGVLRRMTGL